VHFGHRWYSPGVGRWTQPDPLRQPGDPANANPFVYVSGDPINSSDPSGLHPCGAPGPHHPAGENNQCSPKPDGFIACPQEDFHAPCLRTDDAGKLGRFILKLACQVTVDLVTRGTTRKVKPGVPESTISPCDPPTVRTQLLALAGLA
jgi:hypothetical protein